MSAAEIIEQIKALPPDERAEVREFVLQAEQTSENPGVRYATDDAARAAGDEVLGKFREVFQRLAE
jgi:hypothetical protein